MKKLYFLFFLSFSFSIVTAQEMIVNGDFESWDDTTTPTGWTKAENVDQESTEIHGDTYSAKQTASGTKDLAQTITGIVPGDTYDITIWYKVESGDDTDARIWSYWRDASDSNIDNNDFDSEDAIRGPNNGYLDNNGNVWTEYSVSVVAPATAAKFYFELRSYGSAVVYWDDFSFFHQEATSPSLDISTPSEGQIFNPETTEVDVTYVVQAFDVANGTGDGFIQYTVDGGSENDHYDTNPIQLSGLSSGSHTVYMELVDNSGAVLSPEVNATVNFSIASYTQVADLAALRAGTEGGYYEVTGEIIGTWAQSFRNQKWAQDATAGILIDDDPGVITTVYNEGDGITGLKGELGSYAGVMQLYPTVDPGAPSSTGNTIVPVEVTLADFAAAIDDYESEIIRVMGVTVSDLASGGDGTFQASKSYPITDASGDGILRTNFSDADYIGEDLPASELPHIDAIASEYFGTAQIFPRSIADLTLGVINNEIKGFSLYPNPVENTLYINTQANLAKNVAIYDMLGKKVVGQVVEGNTMSIQLTTGIYVIEVEENGSISTQKLIVK